MPCGMSALLLGLITLTVEHFLLPVCASSDVGMYNEVRHNTSMVSTATIMEIQTRTELACVSECRFHCSCMSVNVIKSNTTGFHCTMFNVTSSDESTALTEQIGATYIELEMGKEEDEDCETKMKAGCRSNGVYPLSRMNGAMQMTTHCDMQTGTGGWTMLQRRVDGSVDFYRGWQEYKVGFGDPSGEFWLGLDNIHTLMASGDYTLRFDLWDDTEHRFAEYESATVADEADNYRLDYGDYQGTAGDALTLKSKGRQFSTYDRDNDQAPFSCAEKHKGAWWHAYCFNANPNGLYLNGTTSQSSTGIVWNQFRGVLYSLLRMEIKIKQM